MCQNKNPPTEGSLVDLWGIEPQTHPCHGCVLPLYYRPFNIKIILLIRDFVNKKGLSKRDGLKSPKVLPPATRLGIKAPLFLHQLLPFLRGCGRTTADIVVSPFTPDYRRARNFRMSVAEHLDVFWSDVKGGWAGHD